MTVTKPTTPARTTTSPPSSSSSSPLTVTAILVIAKLEDGTPIHLYSGAPLPEDISAESKQHLSDLGYLSDTK